MTPFRIAILVLAIALLGAAFYDLSYTPLTEEGASKSAKAFFLKYCSENKIDPSSYHNQQLSGSDDLGTWYFEWNSRDAKLHQPKMIGVWVDKTEDSKMYFDDSNED